MFSASYSAGLSGIEGFPVTVECNQRSKLEGFEVVGLPDAAVKEAKNRVIAACENSGYVFPSLEIMISAIFERPVIVPFGMYAMCAFP